MNKAGELMTRTMWGLAIHDGDSSEDSLASENHFVHFADVHSPMQSRMTPGSQHACCVTSGAKWVRRHGLNAGARCTRGLTCKLVLSLPVSVQQEFEYFRTNLGASRRVGADTPTCNGRAARREG